MISLWHTKNISSIEKILSTNIVSGLTDKECAKRREKYGKNKLEEKKKVNIFVRFIKQFDDFMIIVLILAAIISAIVSYVEKNNDYIDSIIIIAIVIFNALMGLIQESKAEKSLEALNKMSAPTAKVKRDGVICEIKSEDVTIGDIVILEAGNYVPADCRIIKSNNLKIDESALSGETNPAIKDANIILKENTAIADMINMAFATTIVTNGNGEGIVTDVAMNTCVGKIAKMIINNETSDTPLQKKLGEIGKQLGVGALFICFAIFLIGIVKKHSVLDMFMTSVGLAVAAIPEGLPAIVTIMLSLGVTKMAKKNTIIRKLPAVETLGSSSVICSDKTGTLTQNRMKVVEVYGYKGNIKKTDDDYKFAFILSSMCNNATYTLIKKKKKFVGEPTEIALLEEGLSINEGTKRICDEMKRIGEIPFDSGKKYMITLHKKSDGYRIICKGAPEVVLDKCTNYYNTGSQKKLGNDEKNRLSEYNLKMASDALRVLAVAYKDVNDKPQNMDLEKDFCFVSLIGMIDPPREGVKEAVSTCTRAGIKTVMITGDHILTAKAIARELGIFKISDLAITGIELDKISDDELEKNIMRYSVFARVSPEHKVRIVKAFQNANKVVAMTGDGVNDAPALKSADIGIAMGKSGTDVAKNAADMILTDDNFVTIVEAVREGRTIYENIQKAVHFLISTNIGEIVTMLLGLVTGYDTPLLAIQLLWINLITDSLPAIALGLEKSDKNIMKKKPRDSKKGFFSDGLWNKIFLEGSMLGIITLVVYIIGVRLYNGEAARTMAFATLSMIELVHAFNIHCGEYSFLKRIFSNFYLLGAMIIGMLMQILVIAIPKIANVFDVIPLNATQWIIVAIACILPIIVMEIQKKTNEITLGKRVYER